MSNNTESRNEAFLLHKHGLRAAAMCMAMPIVPARRFHQSPRRQGGLNSVFARLRTAFAREA